MKFNIAVLPGDGIGPEITGQAVSVLNKIAEIYGHEFNMQEGLMGGCSIDKYGEPLPEETLKLCRSSDAV